MSKSQRFEPIRQLADRKEKDAASVFGKTLRERQGAQQRLTELQNYLAEYLSRYAGASRAGLGGAQMQEYQAFIAKLEQAIAEQEKIVAGAQQVCDQRKHQWRGEYTRSKAMETVLERMRADERRERERREQATSDEHSQRRR